MPCIKPLLFQIYSSSSSPAPFRVARIDLFALALLHLLIHSLAPLSTSTNLLNSLLAYLRLLLLLQALLVPASASFAIAILRSCLRAFDRRHFSSTRWPPGLSRVLVNFATRTTVCHIPPLLVVGVHPAGIMRVQRQWQPRSLPLSLSP